MEEPTQKQQISELLRNGSSFVLTSGKNPDIDELAGVIALAQILEKLGKRAETVIAEPLPQQINFLQTDIIKTEFQGLRDFVIELDTAKVEADKLKYIPEGQKLKIYITPYKGNFKKEDVTTSYGDYHTDAIIALGAATRADLDKVIADKDALLSKTKIITINAKNAGNNAEGVIDWTEPQASSVCEMLMSLTESLQGGLLDNKIATSLLSGIIFATEHFTASNTTPKVMTMAAQLMAAGADQSAIIKNLEQKIPSTPKDIKVKDDNELKPSVERKLPHQDMEPTAHPPKTPKVSKIKLKKKPKKQTFQAPPPPPFDSAQDKQPQAAKAKQVVTEPQVPEFKAEGSSMINDIRQPLAAGLSSSQKTPAGNNTAIEAERHQKIEAARKAVEEATRRATSGISTQNPVPPPPPPPPTPPQQ